MFRKRRSVLSVLLCGVLLIGCLPLGCVTASDAAVPRIIVENRCTRSGSYASIPVRFENVPALSELRFSLTYDPRVLTPTSYSYKGYGWALPGGMDIGGLDGDDGVPALPAERDFNFGPVTDFDGTCVEEYFLVVSCKVADDAAPGDLPIRFNLITAKDLDGNDLAIETQNGVITVALPSITVGSGQMKAGRYVDIPLYYDLMPTLSSLHLNVTFDPRVLSPVDFTYEYKDETHGFLRETQPCDDGFGEPYVPRRETAGAHYDGVLIGTAQASKLFTLRFRVLDDAALGDTPVTIAVAQAKDYPRGENDVTIETVGGVWTVVPRVAGDPDGDGEVTLRDAANLKRFLAGNDTAGTDEDNGDVNGDGKVNLKDVTLLLRYLAGGWGVELI